jgi:hypothetical protein
MIASKKGVDPRDEREDDVQGDALGLVRTDVALLAIEADSSAPSARMTI